MHLQELLTGNDHTLACEGTEKRGVNPCPKCFPETEYGQMFDVTEISGGGTRYESKDSDETDNR